VLTGLVFHTYGLQLTATAVCFWEQELWIRIESHRAIRSVSNNLALAATKKGK